MYIPYFRGKQFDLQALRECAEDGSIADGVVPLVEPVRDSPFLRRAIEAFIARGREILIIDNPEVGQAQRGVAKIHGIEDLFESPHVTPAYILNETFDPARINCEDFAFISKVYLKNILAETAAFKPKFHIIADGARLRMAVKENRVLLTDPFNKLSHGADYLELEDEFYSDDHKYFFEDGYIGHSNYGIDGEPYVDKGYPSRSVVLHILYIDRHNSLRIKHFASDSNESAANPAGKFFEALNKLADWRARYANEVPLTSGLGELISFREKEIFPGAGVIKKLSVKHMLEVYGKLLFFHAGDKNTDA